VAGDTVNVTTPHRCSKDDYIKELKEILRVIRAKKKP
jgi:hypothetical protein